MKLKFGLISFFVICLNFISAQNYRYTIYNTETSNLPQNQIMSLFQDSRGNIWVGTKFGVAKFDGENFKVFGQEDGLVVGDISYIFETKLGEILLCSPRGGITSIIGNEIESYQRPEYIGIMDYTQIEDSLIITGTKLDKSQHTRLLSFKNGNFKLLKEFNIDFGGVRFCEDTFWILAKDKPLDNPRLAYFDKNYNLKNIETTIRFQNFYPHGSSLYLINPEAVYKYDEGLISKIIETKHAGFVKLNKLGVFLFENDKRTLLKHYDFSGNLIDSFKLPLTTNILCDKENNLWFGTEYGIYKRSEKAFMHFVFKDFGIAPDNPGIVFSKNNYWLSTSNGELYNFIGNQFIDYTDQIPVKTYAFMISHIVKPDGTIIWGGGFPGILKQKANEITYTGLNLGSPVYGLYYDTLTNNTIIGYRGLIIENQYGKVIFRLDNFPGIVVEIEKDTVGNYFLAHRRGTCKLTNGKITELPYMALDIVHDSKHNLWFGGEAGLYFYNNKNFTKVEHPTFKNKAITALHEVGDSVLLIGTTSGMAAMDLRAFYNKKKTVMKFYNANNGFSGNECSQNGFAEDNDGFVWIPVNDRLIKIDPRYLSFDNVAVEPYIVCMSVMKNADWIARDTISHELVHYENSIKFSFSGPYFSNPVSYSYYLEGYEDSWSDYGNSKEAVYANLPPGKYTFFVKALNGEEPKDILKASYSFEIKPAFWQTIWFYILLAVVLVAAIYLIVKKIVENRTENQRKQFEQNRLMMQALHAQLDPHFIFNTLTTTGTFALRLKQVGIYDIIVRFSQLLRTHWANKDFTRPLAEELHFIEEYCALNRINHGERFDYAIEIEPGIETNIQVMKLLVQNFVENAMKHGIENITEHGLIKISVRQDEIYTQILIDDNGIGYKKALNLNKERKRTGIKTITETINLYNSWNNFKMEIDIKDKSELDNTSTGTMVTIIIPNHYDYRD